FIASGSLAVEVFRTWCRTELPADRLYGAPRGITITVGVHRVRHRRVSLRGVQQQRDFVDQPLAVRADELDGPCHDGLRPFRVLTHDEDRLAEARGFLLYAAGIRQHDVREAQCPSELRIRQRFDEDDVVQTFDSRLDRGADLRV